MASSQNIEKRVSVENKKENRGGISYLYTLGVGLLPFLYIIKYTIFGIRFDIAFSIICGVLILIYALDYRKIPFDRKMGGVCFLISAYQMFNILIFKTAGIVGIINSWAVYFIDLLFGSVLVLNSKVLKRLLLIIAIVASGCIFAQTILHYVLGLYWTPLPLSLFREDLAEGYSGIMSSSTSVIGLFRPSAFFLEPSHLAEYCLIGLIISLLDTSIEEKKALRIGIVISLGIVLSTSGMGIVCTLVIWIVKIITMGLKQHGSLKIILTLVCIMVILYFVFDGLGVTNLLTIRFSLSGNHSGVIGRVGNVSRFFQDLDFKTFLVGRGADSPKQYWLPGYCVLIKDYGIIGVALELFVLYAACKNVTFTGKMIILLYIGLLFVADCNNASYFLFYSSAALCYTTLGTTNTVISYTSAEDAE